MCCACVLTVYDSVNNTRNAHIEDEHEHMKRSEQMDSIIEALVVALLCLPGTEQVLLFALVNLATKLYTSRIFLNAILKSLTIHDIFSYLYK